MAIAPVNVATSGGSVLTSPVTVTKPAGLAANQVCYLAVYFDGTQALTMPTGFTARATRTWNGAANQEVAATKLLGGSEPAWEISWAGGAGVYIDVVAVTYSGCDASSASAHYVDSVGNSGNSATATGLTLPTPPTRADSYLVWNACSGTGARTTGPTPGSWNNRSTFDTNMYVDDRSIGAGATGAFTSGYPSQEWVTIVLGLQGPAVAAQTPGLFFGATP